MLGEMLQWKNFHDDPTKPPFPWDPEAARWSREYRKKHPDAFPLDQRELLRPERVKLNKPAAAQKAPVQVKIAPANPVAEKPANRIKMNTLELFKKKPNIRIK